MKCKRLSAAAPRHRVADDTRIPSRTHVLVNQSVVIGVELHPTRLTLFSSTTAANIGFLKPQSGGRFARRNSDAHCGCIIHLSRRFIFARQQTPDRRNRSRRRQRTPNYTQSISKNRERRGYSMSFLPRNLSTESPGHATENQLPLPSWTSLGSRNGSQE